MHTSVHGVRLTSREHQRAAAIATPCAVSDLHGRLLCRARLYALALLLQR
jgi:hypothetical protein